MQHFHCGCGALVYYRRERQGGARLLCDYLHKHIVPGAGEASGLDIDGNLVQGSWAASETPRAVEVTPCHLPLCPAELRREWLPYAD